MTQQLVTVCKTFSFDSSHQLIGHFGKCANVHGHTYKLEVKLKGPVITHEEDVSSEGFVIDFYDLKKVVSELIVDKFDHAFLAAGNEPILPVLKETGVKVVELGFRSTVENMSLFVCHSLREAGLPVYSVRMWETPTGWAEVLASDIPESGPVYRKIGGCDCE